MYQIEELVILDMDLPGNKFPNHTNYNSDDFYNDQLLSRNFQWECNSLSRKNQTLNLKLNQIDKFQEIIKNFKTNKSSEIAALVLTNSL